MLPSWCRDTVRVLRAPVVRERGVPVRDWGRAESHDVAGCSLQPASSATSFAEAGQPAQARAVLYCPPGADVRQGDRVEAGGAAWSVDGVPHLWRSPTGRADSLQCSLTEWRG